MKNVLILGGGFAGIQTAIDLQKSGKFAVTLISDRDYLYLYPISIWIPVHQIEPKNVKLPIIEITKKYPFTLIVDKVIEINSLTKSVICEKKSYSYDFLVLAFGSDKMKHKGIENAYSICGNPDISIRIRDEIDKLVQKRSGKIAIGFGGNPKDNSAVRGGPAFELVFNIHNYLKKIHLRESFELTFFAPMDAPGAKMGPGSMEMVSNLFAKFNISKRYGKKILEFTPTSVIFEDQSRLEADLILFIPASTGHSMLQSSGFPLSESGFIKIDNNCQVKGFENVYAIGDIAALEGPDWTAKQGHIAELMGRNAAYNLIETEKGSNNRKGYQEELNILCVMDTGNGAAFVFRNSKKAFIIPLPIIGHWMKKGWGYYSKWTKLGKFPRLPGL